jgi:hypothetical protein
MILRLHARPTAGSELATAPGPSGQIVVAKTFLRSTAFKHSLIALSWLNVFGRRPAGIDDGSVEEAYHRVVMRPLPVHAVAPAADAELISLLPDARRQPVPDGLAGHFGELLIAAETS